MWLLPTYARKVTYARARHIAFTSAKKLNENLDSKIECIDGEGGSSNKTQNCQYWSTEYEASHFSEGNVASFQEAESV